MTHTDETTTAATPQIKRKRTIQSIWLIPLVALACLAYVAIDRWMQQGTNITIYFKEAQDLSANKTQIKYKDVIIGRVTSIKLNHARDGIAVNALISKDNENLLKKDTLFWVVKPRVGITQITGLDTIISGNYLTLKPNPDTNAEEQYTFEGLDKPPILRSQQQGLHVTLSTKNADSITPGTIIYYRGIAVGSITNVYLSKDGTHVQADAFIKKQYQHLVQTNSRFWMRSAVSINTNGSTFEMNVGSLETIMAGGISFDNTRKLITHKAQQAVDGSTFKIFDNFYAAESESSGEQHRFVTYFKGSIQGLSVGSPVTVKGIEVGQVQEISLMFNTDTGKKYVPVLFTIYEDKFNLFKNITEKNSQKKRMQTVDFDYQSFQEQFIKNGIAAQLQISSLLTGTKQIDLVQMDNSYDSHHRSLEIDPITGYAILPSKQETIDALSETVISVINQVDGLPLDSIADNLNKLLIHTDKQIQQAPIQQTLQQLQAMLKSGQTLSSTANSTLKSLNRSLSSLARQTQRTMEGFSPDAPMYYHLSGTLEQLNDTLSSLQSVTDLLDREPNALIFGTQQKPSRSTRND